MAQYVFWTGDETGVARAVEELIQQGLVSFKQDYFYSLITKSNFHLYTKFTSLFLIISTFFFTCYCTYIHILCYMYLQIKLIFVYNDDPH